jgi:hypothetical protein
MGTKSRESIYGGSIRASAEARKQADRLAVKAWNDRLLGYKGPAQPSPTIGDALNAGHGYLEVRCLGCDTHQTIALDIIRRPKTTPIHELERRRSGAIRSSAATSSRCGQPRFPRVTRRRLGGRKNDDPNQPTAIHGSPLMSAIDIVPYAQMGTTVIATAALVVATWSLLAQKAVARRRAAIDFFLNTEMDEKMLAAYNIYVQSKAKMNTCSDMTEFCRTEHYDHVRAYLNILELMAVGVHHKTFDQRICFVYWCDFIKGAVKDCRPLLDHLRKLPSGSLSYRDLVRLEKRWSSAKRFWQRWRS